VREVAEAPGGGALQDHAGLVVLVSLGIDERQHAAQHRHGREPVREAGHHVFELAKPTLLPSAHEDLGDEEDFGTLVLRALSYRPCVAGELLTLLEPPLKQRPERPIDRHVPQVKGLACWFRDQRACLQLSMGARHITQLEPIGDQPTMTLKSKLDISRLIGQSQQLGCDAQPLIEGVRSPDHEPPSVEGKAQRGAIVDPACQVDSVLDERVGPPSIG
jgi:hypothetical protein